MPLTDSNKPLTRVGKYGTLFTAERADLCGGVRYMAMEGMRPDSVAKDFFEFGTWHAEEIRLDLNDFQGYGDV